MKAIVTGHSRGLGAAVAAELLGRDIPVLGLSRKTNPELAQRFPALLRQAELDLADSTALTQWIADGELAAFQDGGPVLLVNNAGVVQPVGPLNAQAVDEVARAVALNVAAPLMLSAALCATRQAGEVRILHVSSGAARNAYPGWSIYCATKAALDHHARAVVLDKLPGVRICSLAPGVIDTDMQAAIRSTSLENFPLRERFEAMKREGSLASPADCARRLADYLLGARFGESPVADLRDF
ncbi:SDR family oxidoreductase [Noviherbaspirillum denitrificans]|uniref:Short-chain dehydrogenase n=1 Tax=Noviherbaspirillum denitrificans TaxID=1968433 RepID=A0A254THK2_9BURK|nr:SDR family oxidoreductase [Noviherbaspirillum denitrificans]OWW22119.1 short-chain dehydrogenase [Noviherbaspirillum denitrificans]